MVSGRLEVEFSKKLKFLKISSGSAAEKGYYAVLVTVATVVIISMLFVFVYVYHGHIVSTASILII